MRQAAPAKAPTKRRLASLDWMRGIVMVLMVVDHASLAYNGDRVSNDSAATYSPGDALEPLGFLVRWVTHLCAPTFLLLAGTALAISVERRIAKGQDPRAIDRDIVLRGLIILLVDPILISFGVRILTFQVMYAIGAAMMLMPLLRRLPAIGLLVVSVGWMVGGELLTGLWWSPTGDAATSSASLPVALTMAWSISDSVRVIYPLLPWLSMMALGWWYGRHLLAFNEGRAKISPAMMMAIAGVIALVTFVVVRGLNGYGNMFLLRDDGSWVQWLHVSKYPPSLTFCALELGILFLSLAGLMVLEKRVTARENGVLLVFGQTAFFFYVIHRFVFDVSANWFGLKDAGGLGATLVASALMLAALYPACRWYRTYKRAHPTGLVRFL
jgi:uncharacterized membrane protein